MKKYIVTLLLSVLVVMAGLALRRTTAKAATTQAQVPAPLVAVSTKTAFTPAINLGPGPMPCPPSCGL